MKIFSIRLVSHIRCSEMIVLVISVFWSTMASIVFLVTWYLIPQWRNLHNYISGHQIVTGTLHLYSILINRLFFDGHNSISIALNQYLFMITLTWSLCASLFAYLKLVLVFIQTIPFEKAKATIFAYGAMITIKILTNVIIPTVIPLDTVLLRMLPVMISIYMILSVNFMLFACIARHVVKSCNLASRARGKRIASLVCVAILCDFITLIYLSSIVININLLYVLKSIFYLRLIPQAIVVLFNQNSRRLWKLYFQMRRYRNIDLGIELVSQRT
ncbi:unnamed protein product [Pieris macdunnoughi]|uniref:Uncharacterized protein n=1 Tax=Pieris macdunnoughi TaxID=345717 RepID=A0A821WV36_9NEOP|nr:unnamed protein product [Pieris macdunnoughi]